jgi:RHS repeat-associated protein
MTCFVSSPASLASKRFFQLLSRSMLFLFLVNSIAANAQDLAGLEQGIKPYGSYHGGDIDSVSMVNGSLTLNIPIISYPQRGGKLHMGFVLVYANAILQPFASCNPVTHVCSTSGYQVNHRLQAPDQTAISIVPDFLPSYVDGINTPSVVTSFDGAVHEMGQVGTSGSNFLSVDATGNWFTQQGSNLNLGTLIDREGNRYNNSTGTLEDTNGNLITQNSNSQEVTGWNDTIGRVIPAPWNTTSTSNLTGCTGSQPTTGAGLWTPPGPNGGTSQFKFCYASFPISFTAPDCIDDPAHSNCQGTSASATYLQNLVLPNGTAWTFEYDVFGELSSVTLPTGGTISYTWTYTSGVCVGTEYMQNGVNTWLYPYGRAVTSRTVNANDGTGSHVWNYSIPTTINNGSSSPVQSTVTDPLLNDTVHWQTPLGGSCSRYETELDQYSGSHTSGTRLRRVATTYNYTFGGSGFVYGSVAINAVPSTITTTEYPSGQASEVTKTYDSGVPVSGGYNAIYGDVLTRSNYDYTSGTPPGNLLRTTVSTYMALSGPNSSSYLANNLLDLPYTVQVKNGAGAQVAYTTFGYDESGLQSSGITEQKTSGESYPGNQTSLHRWLNASTTATTNCNVSVSNGYLVSNMVYYDTGEVQKSIDPCLYWTTYLYSPTYYGAFPTTVTNDLNQNTTYAYDFNTGAVTSITDPNLQPTAKSYDAMARLTQINYPDGGSTAYCYTDEGGATCTKSGPPYAVVVTKAITSSPVLNEISTVTFDGLGRLSQTQLNSDPEGADYTLTTYDALGRKSQVYNPTRCSSITTNCKSETTWGYTTTSYDPLNRATAVTEQDGSVVQMTYDQTNPSSTGVCSTVKDEAGNSRQSCADGLGRMTGVWEDPAHSNYETDYTYDALSNLLSVTQKGSNSANARVRTFVYDSLSHLTSASNPESGTILYAYDADGNVITKTAPAPNQTGSATVTTTSYYDQLNRLTKKVYSDGTTPWVYFAYDVAPGFMTDLKNVVGRLANSTNEYGGSISTQATAATYSYDAMGRVIREWEQTPSASPGGFYIYSSYDLLGNLASTTSAPGTTISLSHDGASRLTAVTSSLNDAQHPPTLWSADPTQGYYPHGALEKATFGNGLTESTVYESRLTPCRINLNTSGGIPSGCSGTLPNGIVESYQYYYGNWGSNVNGNILVWGASGAQNFNRGYIYDSLNRIQSMSDVPPQTCQGLSWTIDAWGNMTNQTQTAGTCYTFQSSVGTNNQLQSGYQYDAAGNMTYDGLHHYTYDAENRLTQVDSGSTSSYVYNESGDRARKNVGAGFTEYSYGTNGKVQSEYNGISWLMQYVYAGNNLIAEYTANSTTQFIFADHLGSTRLVTAVNQSIVDNMDYLPFGQQIAGGSSTTHRFTGKERDAESGLDMFGARYYGSSLGRFMTPDWAAKATAVPYADFGDPQTLNLYGYVRNNPLSKADADGHCYPWCTVAVGAVAGFVIGGGGEIIAAKLHGQSVDWKKVGGSAVKGAVTGAAIGLAGPEAGVAATAALGAGGNVLGGVADRTIQGQSAKEVLSPTEVAKDAASGAIGGAIGGAKVGETAGEFIANGSAKVATASGDQAAANFYSNNASAIGTGVAKTIDVGQSTAESYHDQSNQQQPQQQQQQKPQCSDRTSCH